MACDLEKFIEVRSEMPQVAKFQEDSIETKGFLHISILSDTGSE